MAMEYEGLQQLADWEGLPLDSVLKDFKDAGVTSLIVFDTTLQKLDNKGLVYAVPGREAFARRNCRNTVCGFVGSRI